MLLSYYFLAPTRCNKIFPLCLGLLFSLSLHCLALVAMPLLPFEVPWIPAHPEAKQTTSTANLPKLPASAESENPPIEHLEESQEIFESQLEDYQITTCSESQFNELDDLQATLVATSQARPSRDANPGHTSADVGHAKTSQ